MIRKIINLALVLVIAVSLFFAPAIASASVFSVCNHNSAASGSTLCSKTSAKASSNPLTGSKGLLLTVANVIALVAGLAAVIVIIISGLRLVTSGGEPSKTQGARSAIVYALVGLVVIALAYTIMGFVLSRL